MGGNPSPFNQAKTLKTEYQSTKKPTSKRLSDKDGKFDEFEERGCPTKARTTVITGKLSKVLESLKPKKAVKAEKKNSTDWRLFRT